MKQLISFLMSIIMMINTTMTTIFDRLIGVSSTPTIPVEEPASPTSEPEPPTPADEKDPVLPIFDSTGKQTIMQPGVWYNYKTSTKNGGETVGKAMVYNYEITNGNDYLPAKEGYVWKIADIAVYFSDDAAYSSGFNISFNDANGYDYVNSKESTENVDTYTDSFHITWKGSDIECLMRSDYILQPWRWTMGHYSTLIRRVAYRVPADFDGMAVMLRNSAITIGNDESLVDKYGDGEGYLVFRFGNSTDASLADLTTFGCGLPFDPFECFNGDGDYMVNSEDVSSVDTSTVERGATLDTLSHRYLWFGDSFGWIKVMW